MMVPSCLAREGSEDARARREASVLPRSDLLLIWADRRGVSSPQNSPSGKRQVIKRIWYVQYKQARPDSGEEVYERREVDIGKRKSSEKDSSG